MAALRREGDAALPELGRFLAVGAVLAVVVGAGACVVRARGDTVLPAAWDLILGAWERWGRPWVGCR